MFGTYLKQKSAFLKLKHSLSFINYCAVLFVYKMVNNGYRGNKWKNLAIKEKNDRKQDKQINVQIVILELKCKTCFCLKREQSKAVKFLMF